MSTNTDLNEMWGDDDLNDLNINELGKILDNPLPKESLAALRTNEQHIGFDNNAGRIWMYPSNMPMRSYQYSITQAALYKNTLVVLPTGLGKTFIAAVVMYNMYRWYPTGKVIFMAPTRPLVAQQIEACKNIMPFPLEDTIELTGKLQRDKRLKHWREKRVFFATPQAIQADMFGQNGTISDFPFQQIKLIVVDEAHRAKGRYAYVEVAQALYQHNKYFRVLALSATPGRTMEDVAEVIRNLFISHLEVRWDNSIDVMQYVHQRSIKTIVVPFGESISRIREQLIKIIDPYMRQLIEADVLSASHQNITKNVLIMEQKRFLERSLQQSNAQKSVVTSNFSICISLYHALELLERHGLRVFLNSFEDDEAGRPKFVLAMNPNLRNLVKELRSELGPNPFDVSAHIMTNGQIPEIPKDLEFGHPKFEKARECILAHFENNPESRAIVFCEYRESVMMIYRLLLQNMPLLKPKCFVGQGGTTGALRALSQKQQIQIMNDFRAGKSNILIATSIGEEGIDVGEVDLIVCFDINTTNPTRFVQRIGRTGRQRRGRVIMLVTEGKEQKILQDVLANKDQTNKKLLRSSVVQTALYKHSPRMVPTEFSPECVHIHVKPRTPPPTNENKNTKMKKEAMKQVKKPSKSKTKPIENTQDLRKFFKKYDLNVDDDEDANDADDFEPHASISAKATTMPLKITQQSMQRVERLFQHLQPCRSSNTQLLTTQTEIGTKQTKLDVQYLKKVNKFLKSSTDALQPLNAPQNLLLYLKSESCSKAAKMFMLKKSYKQVLELREQMSILQALNVDNEADMSTHELEIRQTYQLILDLFENAEAFQRFLEDAEFDELAAKKLEKQSALSDWSMSKESYQNAKAKIFQGLDVQGINCDNFDYRLELLKQTKTYQQFIEQKTKTDKQQPPSNVVGDSMVFNAMTTHADSLEDMTFNSLATNEVSKYANAMENDSHSFDYNSTVMLNGGYLSEAFEKPKTKTQTEPFFESDVDDEDLISLTLENEQSQIQKMLQLKENAASSFQQSTPIQSKKFTKPQHEIEHEIAQAFEATLPVDFVLSGSSLKENTKPKEVEKIDVDTSPNRHNATSLFEMLENKPVNSILTPKRSFTKIAQQSKERIISPMLTNVNSAAQTSIKTTTEQETGQALNVSSTTRTTKTTPKAVTPKNMTPKATTSKAMTPEAATPPFQTKLNEYFDAINESSPKNQLQTSTKAYEKSPSIFSKFTRGLQRFESRRKIQINDNDDNNKSSTAMNAAENSDLDSPVVGKRRIGNNQNLKRKIIIESDTETEETTLKHTNSRSSNSDDDFEQLQASPKLKRKCLPKQISKPSRRRARLYNFIDEEAAKSDGSGHTDDDEDEAHENSLGDFVCDSIIIPDEDEHDETGTASATQMQAIYLQSVNSPNRRKPGGFKIPAPRNYDIDVYSQAVPVEPSHYGLDSFVVHEEDVEDGKNATLCPLEQAERILKERRRQAKRRRCAAEPVDIENHPTKKRARKCYQLSSDSSDDCGG